MSDRLPIAAAGVGIAAVWLLDPWSIPAMLLGVVLGIVLGATMLPETVDVPVEGPIAALRRRQPWTEPGFAV